MEEIECYIYGQKIGTMIENNGTIFFEYDKSFRLSKLEISPIKLETKKIIKPHQNKDHRNLYQGMAGVFFDSLPDKHGMAFIDRYFERQGLRSSEVTLLHKLAFIGDRGMGAIEYLPKEHNESIIKDSIVNAKEAYEKMKTSIESENSSIEDLINVLDSVSPVGGGRPKMLVQYDYLDNKILLNNKKLAKGTTRAIIKFDEVYEGVGTIGLTKLEFIAMSMAKEIGIDTADFNLIEENGLHHLIIKRFDREDNDEKIHMCTASGLMHIDISVPLATSYENLFTLTRKLCRSEENIEELFKRMVFNVLIINFDDHTKNFAYLMDKKGKWKISPAYDIKYSKGLAKQHITTIQGKSFSITRADLLKVAKLHSIKLSTAQNFIDRSIEVIKTFEERAKKLQLDEKMIKECKRDIDEQILLCS